MPSRSSNAPNWIDAFEDEAQARADAAERKRAEEARRKADAAEWRANERGREETRRNFSGALNAKYFEPAIERVTEKMMRSRIIEMRKQSANYLRDYTDQQIEEWLRRPDIEGRETAFDVSITGPELVRDEVVQVIHIKLPSVHHVLYVCPRTGRVTVMTPIDLNHTATKRKEFSDSISSRIDAVVSQAERLEAINEVIASIDLTLPHEERAGRSVSASAIGDECQRRTQLNIWPTFHPNKPIPKQAPLDDKTRIVFARGHATETLVAGWMQAAGFDLVTHVADEPTKQFGFVCADGQIKGYADGVLNGLLGDSLTLWENKTIAAKGHRAVAKHGVLKQYPKYDVQAQMLMAYLEMPATLFSFLNAETGALHFELMPFDQHRAQAASDTAVHILIATRAGELLPKAGFSGDKFPCGWRDKETGEMTGCRFRNNCWDT